MYKELGEVFYFRNGYTPSKENKEFWENGLIPWFRIEDIRRNGRILSDSIQKINFKGIRGKIFPKNSIIISTTATIGQHALIKVEYVANQQFTIICLKEEYFKLVNMKFIYYYFFIIGEWCRRNIEFGSIDRVNIGRLKKFKIFIPMLERQKEIVHILDSFSSLKEKIIGNLENEIELREKQFKYYRDKLFRDIIWKKKFHWKNVGEVCEILNSRRKPIAKTERRKGKFPYYGANGILDFVDNYVFDGEFLLVGEDGSVINEDNSPVLNWAVGKIVVNNHAHVLVAKEGVKLKYLYYLLQTVNVRKLIKGMPRKFGKKDLMEIRIPIPKMEEQERIILILDKFCDLVGRMREELFLEIDNFKKIYDYYRVKVFEFGEF